MSFIEDKSPANDSTDNSNNNNNNENGYRGSDYPSSSFSEIEEISEEDGNNKERNANPKRLEDIKEGEISRLCPSEGSRDEEDIVYVVVGKSEASTKALQWTLYNAVNPVTSTLYLIHIFPELKMVPSPLGNGKVLKSQVSKKTLDMYLDEERTKRRLLLNNFINTCNAHRVKVETILIESEHEAKAILELISVLNIQKLVVGVSKSDLRKLRSRKGNGIPDKILQKAPDWCEVKYICEGKDAFEDNPVAETHEENQSEADLENDQKTHTPSPNLTTDNVAVQNRDVPSFTYCCFKPPTH